MFRVIGFCMCLWMAMGCASLSYRTEHKEVRSGAYPGVRTDAQWIRDVSKDHSDEGLAGAMLDGLKFIVIPASTIDFPLSFVLDTVLLPVDLLTKEPNRQ